ncbi:hypothetical protein BT69DRAFT_1331870 [Atractiella rhizophila]|nr:hypothetical protein BT69DRAFT_1331870 [Atractiella rhizophila]
MSSRYLTPFDDRDPPPHTPDNPTRQFSPALSNTTESLIPSSNTSSPPHSFRAIDMESSAGTTGLIIDGVPSILRVGFTSWWAAMRMGLQVRMVYRYALDELVGTEDFRRTQPLRNTFSNLSQWEDAMECWEAGNAKAVAIVLANLDLTAANQLSEEEKHVASSIVARMRALYSTTQAVMGHTIIAKLITFYQSGSGCTSLAQFITKWNAIYAELLSADSAYTLSDAVRFLLFVNLLEPEWRKFALNPKNVTRNDLNDLFQKLKAEDVTNTVLEHGDPAIPMHF